VKILLDESVPALLRNELRDHEVYTVTWLGWSGTKNGTLLGLAIAADFDVIVTCDRNIQHQQNLSTLNLALVVLAVLDTRKSTLLPLVPDILATLASKPQPGTISVIGTWRVEGR
jgi:hypothetical protein